MRNNIDVGDPSDVDDYSNWIGGWYELAIVVGPADDARLERVRGDDLRAQLLAAFEAAVSAAA